jgi:DNA-directed RNA polymerase specialized sigma24 family protein
MDLTTFNRLITTYQEIAYDLACYILCDRERAVDVVEASVTGLHRSSHDLDVHQFRCRLLANVVHSCMESIGARRPTLRREHAVVDWDASLNDLGASLTQLLPLNDAITNGLLAMDVGERLLLLLHDRYDCSNLETAAVIGLSPGVVRRRLIQSRIVLRNYLSEYGEFPPIGVRSSSQ